MLGWLKVQGRGLVWGWVSTLLDLEHQQHHLIVALELVGLGGAVQDKSAPQTRAMFRGQLAIVPELQRLGTVGAGEQNAGAGAEFSPGGGAHRAARSSRAPPRLSDDGVGSNDAVLLDDKRASISCSDMMGCDENPGNGAPMEACAAISRSSARTMAVLLWYACAQG